jgi:hypothetical protein
VIAEALVRRAAKGDVRAFREIADRIEGKPRQAVEFDVGVDGEPIPALHHGTVRQSGT